jgi:hexokinase
MRARAAQLIQLTKGYRIRRVLDNKVINVLQAKLAYKVLVFLSRK